jgi:hypothetical protein
MDRNNKAVEITGFLVDEIMGNLVEEFILVSFF